MPKTKAQKKDVLEALTMMVTGMKAAVFTSFHGLNIADEQAFRKQVKKAGAGYMVAKKTLIRLALKNVGITTVDPVQFKMETGILVSPSDEVAPAKLAAMFGKTHALKILGGILEGNFVDEAGVQRLAAIPSKPELLAKMVGSMQAPISGFVRVLAGNLRGLVQVLSQIQQKKN